MQPVTKSEVTIAAIVFVLIAVLGDGIWAAVEAFALSPQGVAMLSIFMVIIAAAIFGR